MKKSDEITISKHKQSRYKIVGIGTLTGDISVLSLSPPKIESGKFTREISLTHTSSAPNIVGSMKDDEYELIKKTADIMTKLIHNNDVTIDGLLKDVLQKINDELLNIHEVYTVLTSYSLWEVIIELIKIHPVEKISRNGHGFTPLHKALLPSWLWNYHNEIQEMPKNLHRTTNDMYETVKYLLTHNLTGSVLEMTPRRHPKTHLPWETSIVLVTQTIPRRFISDVYDKLYDLLTSELTDDRLILEIDSIIPQIPCNVKTVDHNIKMKNELRWVIIQNPQLFATRFAKCCEKIETTMASNKMDVLLEMTKCTPEHDNIFDTFFNKHQWTAECAHTLCSEINLLMNSR